MAVKIHIVIWVMAPGTVQMHGKIVEEHTTWDGGSIVFQNISTHSRLHGVIFWQASVTYKQDNSLSHIFFIT